jgi:tetratricopeptide (TPR) repeat protein
MRAVLVTLVLVAPLAVAAAAPRAADPAPAAGPAAPRGGEPAPAPPVAKPDPASEPARAPATDGAKAVAILERIARASGPGERDARAAAIAELTGVAPGTLDAIAAWVARPEQAPQAERRRVLVAIGAAVPDQTGKFTPPPRPSGKPRAADAEVDWLAALLKLDAGEPAAPAAPAPAGDAGAETEAELAPLTGTGDVIAAVAAIRALAATRDPRAATLLLDLAFGADTIIYRDECGRYLRKLEPYSIPGLTRAAQASKDPDRRRYATWQLERIDRQDPLKALGAAAGDERLVVAILDAFRAVRLREAVHAVWTKVADDSPAIRGAARATWMDYIVGPAPPPAPRKKLQLPGGKLTKEPKPLWLTYRELADNELRRAANDLLGEDFPLQDDLVLDDKTVHRRVEKIDLAAVTARLFAHFDGLRAQREAAQWAAAKAKADAGDLATAATLLDRLIATSDARAERAEMAAVYAAWGKQLEAQQRWADASAAYSKAHGLDPTAATAAARLAAHHFTLGKALEAQGKDGGPDYRRAVALQPDYAPAQTAAERVAAAGRPTWMLVAAGVAALAALALAGAGLRRRRLA